MGSTINPFMSSFSQAILHASGSDKPLPERIAATQEVLSAASGYAGRRIQQEPQVIYFLFDRIDGRSDAPQARQVKDTLFGLIAASQGQPEHGVSAANAVTLLNWLDTSLMHQSWSEVHLPGADLTHAM